MTPPSPASWLGALWAALIGEEDPRCPHVTDDGFCLAHNGCTCDELTPRDDAGTGARFEEQAHGAGRLANDADVEARMIPSARKGFESSMLQLPAEEDEK